MADLPVMDPDTLYGWVVVDTRTLERKGRQVRSIKSSCTTNDLTISEEFWLDDNGRCPALEARYAQLNGATNPVTGTDALGKGKNFFARIYPVFTTARNGRVEYIFNYTSFTTSHDIGRQGTGIDVAVQTAGIRKWVLTMCHETPVHKDRLDKCVQMGSAYIKEFRKMQNEKVI